jgi:4-carboxymuconolactone decarboxylase
MGDHLRFRTSLSPRVRELAILVTCREWGQQYEWAVHYPLAVEAGVRRDIADAIADGRRPYGADEEEEVALSLVSEILHNRRVSDVTWRKALQQFGESGAVDLLGLAGYYSFLGVVLNGARTPAPDGAQLRPFTD